MKVYDLGRKLSTHGANERLLSIVVVMLDVFVHRKIIIGGENVTVALYTVAWRRDSVKQAEKYGSNWPFRKLIRLRDFL